MEHVLDVWISVQWKASVGDGGSKCPRTLAKSGHGVSFSCDRSGIEEGRGAAK